MCEREKISAVVSSVSSFNGVRGKARILPFTVAAVILLSAFAALGQTNFLPNLSIINPSVTPTSVYQGGSFQISFTVTNGGNARAASSTCNMTLNNIYPLGTVSIPALNSGESSPITRNVTLSPGILEGGDIYIKVDPDNIISESNEQDNQATVRLTVLPPPTMPDLYILSPAVSPSSVAAGGSVQVSFTVKNGGTAAGSSTCEMLVNGFYPLGTVSIPALAAGASYNVSTNATISAGILPGSVEVNIRADSGGSVQESDEQNNTARVTLTILPPPTLPDLYILTPSVSPSSAPVGGSVQVSFTVKNGGTAAASSTCEITVSGFYPLGTVSIPALAAGASYNASKSVTISQGILPGSGQVYIRVDSGNTIDESDENNNLAMVALTILPPPTLPDLYVLPTPSVSPTSVSPGGSVQLTFTVTNGESGAAAGSTCEIYLSGNYPLGTASIPGLAAGASYTVSAKNLTIPAGVLPGSYDINILVDAAGTVTESNEENNSARLTLRVGPPQPDLRISSGAPVPIPSSVQPGETVQLGTFTIQNSGSAASGTFAYGFYLSADAAITTADLLLLGDRSAELAPGASSTLRAPVLTIPASQKTGNYYIGILVDSEGTVAEADENNNYSSAPLSVLVLSISPSSRTHGFGPEKGTVTVTAPSGLAWTAASNDPWIRILSGASGTGSGSVEYVLTANLAFTARRGTLTIGGTTFTVDQSGVAQVAVSSVNPVNRSCRGLGFHSLGQRHRFRFGNFRHFLERRRPDDHVRQRARS